MTLQDDKNNSERTILFIIVIRHNRTLRRMSSDFGLKCCFEAVPRGFVNAIETTTSEWYDHIKFFINHGFLPQTLDSKKCRALRLK